MCDAHSVFENRIKREYKNVNIQLNFIQFSMKIHMYLCLSVCVHSIAFQRKYNMAKLKMPSAFVI